MGTGLGAGLVKNYGFVRAGVGRGRQCPLPVPRCPFDTPHRKVVLRFVGRQPNFLLCHGLNMHPALILSCYYLIWNELLEKMELERG